MRLPGPILITVLFLTALAAAPRPAAAQWYLEGAAGASHSLNATVSIRQPSEGIALDFRDVKFEGQSNYPRRYYSARFGHTGKSGRIGWEIEQIHLKAVGLVDRTYDVTAGAGTSLPSTGVSPMNLYVQEYQMTHGVNLAVFNIVMYKPLGGSASAPVSLSLRLGAGASFPHAEATVNGGVIHQYEFGGPGAQAAAGVRLRVLPRLAAITDYKFTWTRPKIDIVGGDAWTTLVSHHVIVGFSIGLTR
jgi:hypothetical protein